MTHLKPPNAPRENCVPIGSSKNINIIWLHPNMVKKVSRNQLELTKSENFFRVTSCKNLHTTYDAICCRLVWPVGNNNTKSKTVSRRRGNYKFKIACPKLDWLIDWSLNYLYGGATRFTNKQTWRTFTASQDCVTIPIRVYPVISVNHLISFTVLDLTARFSRKLLNGAKRNCMIKERNSLKTGFSWMIVLKYLWVTF